MKTCSGVNFFPGHSVVLYLRCRLFHMLTIIAGWFCQAAAGVCWQAGWGDDSCPSVHQQTEIWSKERHSALLSTWSSTDWRQPEVEWDGAESVGQPIACTAGVTHSLCVLCARICDFQNDYISHLTPYSNPFMSCLWSSFCILNMISFLPIAFHMRYCIICICIEPYY